MSRRSSGSFSEVRGRRLAIPALSSVALRKALSRLVQRSALPPPGQIEFRTLRDRAQRGTRFTGLENPG
jgi:hypothetical protein